VFKSKGFTLVEVMVAMLIVGVALPALLFQVMAMVDGTAELRDKAVSQWVAENQLTRLRLQKKMSGRALSGALEGEAEMLGETWFWIMSSEATDVEGMRRLDIEVGRDPEAPTITLVAFSYD